jgi:hypothetical protein
MTDRKLSGPPADELPALAAALVEEVNMLLSSPRWRLLRQSSTVNHHAHAAAALRHVGALLIDIVEAAKRRREAALRVLSRAHLEAWIVGMYVMAFGDEALADIEAGYVKAISAQQNRLADYNKQLQRDIKKAKAQNKRIRAANKHAERWNEAHPHEEPKPLVEEVPVPMRTAVDLDLDRALGGGAPADEVSPLALAGIVARLNQYGRAQEGPDAVFDMVYDLGYRGLSTLGAHSTLWVLKAYLDFSERSTMVGTVAQMAAPSMAGSALNTGVMLTAALSQKVIALKGDEAPVASSVSARYRIEEVQ